MDMISVPKQRAIAAFMQQTAGVDPSDPTYKFHSQGIIDTIQKLLDEFLAKKNRNWTPSLRRAVLPASLPSLIWKRKLRKTSQQSSSSKKTSSLLPKRLQQQGKIWSMQR